MPEGMTQFAQVFEKLAARDAEGFLRAAAHALVDPAVDSLIEGLRHGPAAREVGQIAGSVVTTSALPAAPIAMAPPVDVTAAESRIAELTSANRGLTETIARMSREAKNRRQPRKVGGCKSRHATPPGKGPAATPEDLINSQEAAVLAAVSPGSISYFRHHGFPASVSRRGRAHLWRRVDVVSWAYRRADIKARAPQQVRERAIDAEKAEAMDRALDYEDAAPANPPSEAPNPPSGDHIDPGGQELIDTIGVASALRCSKAMVRLYAKRADFPKIVTKRGLAFLWRRSEIDAWIASRPVKRTQDRPAPEPIAESSDLLDARAVAALIGKSLGYLYVLISTGEFPVHTATSGQKHLWRKGVVEDWQRTRSAADRPKREQSTAATVESHASGDPCCLNCQYSRTIPDAAECRCKKPGGLFENQVRSPRATCGGHKRWSARLKADTPAEE
jgi:predicted DNA-binding transcriptional regulator AlpA